MYARHVSAVEIHRRLVEFYGEEVMSRQSVAKRCSDFKSHQAGQRIMREVADRQQQAPPRKKARVEATILGNRRVTVSELEHDLSLSHGTIGLFRS